MRVLVDEKTGVISLVFNPTDRKEAERVLEYSIRLYRREGYDVSQVVAVQDRLNHESFTIQ